MTFVSAGIGGGSPEIIVRQGGRVFSRISGSIRQMDDEMKYRIVVEETDRYQGRQVTVAPFENLDVGSLVLAVKQTENGVWPRDTVTVVVEVTNPVTGRIWMDRNLGASRTATSSTDTLAYGDQYQWGRPADGHQKRNSPTISTLSSSDQPGHGSFILASDRPYNWRSPQNNDLWQGVNGINNPCPAGYRLPAEAEWSTERASWHSKNATGAFDSPLKLPMAGNRNERSGSLLGIGSVGHYWSGDGAMSFTSNTFTYRRATGASVRCIKD